jgi:ATP-dependent RNA helicase DeaD|nr:DEAD/DEAH box helicase [Candidatus Krumholzibacteria bacterium]
MSKDATGFSELNLAPALLKAVGELGYESTLPIQAACIPALLEGQDVLGMAQTGTGKTAAFALPLLSRIDLSNNSPQVLVLTPTRELAIQVAESFQAYARYLKGFHVLPIYGGQRYSFQFNQLRRGPHVIVGTPGRIQDHLNRKTLDLSGISTFVLDEADEMLRMGFVEDVEAIMSMTPEGRQMALFSATMPPQIKRICQRYLKDPHEVRIEAKTITADNIEQVYVVVNQAAKFEALVRLLETESYDGILIFARTRVATTELAEKLSARGFDIAALNGDMNQTARERTIKRLKSGNIDIVVATDVAARGLDVDRISLVINYDIPGDSEAYIHRIGRTGRAGRSGKAILFAGPRERHILKSIERVTRQTLNPMEVPGHDEVTSRRVEKFAESLGAIMGEQRQDFFENLAFELMESLNVDILQLAAGALCLAQKDKPLRADKSRTIKPITFEEPPRSSAPQGGRGRPSRNMTLFRIEVGSEDGLEVRNIVGAIANETGIRSRFIGQIRIHPKYSTVELPEDVPQNLIEHLRTTYVAGKPMKISRSRGGQAFATGQNDPGPAKARPARPPRPKKAKSGIGKKTKKPKKPKKAP